MIINLTKNQEQVVTLSSTTAFSENLTVNLNGNGARIIVAGILLAHKEEVVNFTINVNHNAPNTVSDIFIRSVLKDKADVHLEGMVRIKKGAKGTSTYLKEDALLLSPDAKAYVLPSLEIDENEVKAGHSSAVGPVDPEQLFYLQSRGLDGQEAEKMLVAGFLFPVRERLKKQKLV